MPFRSCVATSKLLTFLYHSVSASDTGSPNVASGIYELLSADCEHRSCLLLTGQGSVTVIIISWAAARISIPTPISSPCDLQCKNSDMSHRVQRRKRDFIAK